MCCTAKQVSTIAYGRSSPLSQWAAQCVGFDHPAMGQQLQLQLQLWQPLPKGHWEEGAPLTQLEVIQTEGEGTHGGTVYTSLLHQISKFKLKGRGPMVAESIHHYCTRSRNF